MEVRFICKTCKTDDRWGLKNGIDWSFDSLNEAVAHIFKYCADHHIVAEVDEPEFVVRRKG